MPWPPRPGRSSVPVLCYHNIGGNGVPYRLFAEQMRMLADLGITTLTLAEFESFLNGQDLDGPGVLITFDDGFRDIYTRVWPLFEQLDLVGTMFIINNRVRPDDQPGIEEDIVAHEAHRDFTTRGERAAWLSAGEIRQLQDSGRFDVGSHSMAHMMGPVSESVLANPPDHWSYAAWDKREGDRVPRLAPELAQPLYIEQASRFETGQEFAARVENNLADSRRELEDLTGRPVNSLAWPWGKCHPLGVAAARRAGFKMLFTLQRGAVAQGSAKDGICRLEVRRNKDISWLRKRLAVYSRKTWAGLYSAFRI